MNTVKMTALALRSVMGTAFDRELYEKGRQDTRACLEESPDQRAESWELLKKIRQVMEEGDPMNEFGPSYWVGCLSELDFI